MFQTRRRNFGQPTCQANGGWIGEPEIRDMGDFPELLPQGRIETWMPVSVDVAPQTAHPIQIAAAMHINECAALGPLDKEGLVLRHLREGVPDNLAVPLLQLLEGRGRVLFSNGW